MRLFLLAGALAAPGCLLASREDVEQLEARVAALEAAAANAQGPSELRSPGHGTPGPVKQRQGQNLLEEARTLIDSGEVKLGVGKLRECTVLYPESASARTAMQLVEALAVVGTPVKTVPVERWIGGKPITVLGDVSVILLWDAQSLDAVRDVAQFDRVTRSARAAEVMTMSLVRLSEAAAEASAHKVIADAMVSLPVGVETAGARELFKQASLPAAIIVREGRVAWVDHPSRLTQESIKTLLR